MKKTFGIIGGGVFILLVLSGLSFAGMCGDHTGEEMMGGSSSGMGQTSGNRGGDHPHGAHQQDQMQTMGQNMQDPGMHNEIMERMMNDPKFMNQMMAQMMANQKIRDLIFNRMMQDQEMRGRIRMMQQAASTH